MASADTALETGDADVDNLVDGELDSLLDTDDELSNQELDREDEDDDTEDRDGKLVASYFKIMKEKPSYAHSL